jgi:hypothetical protein
VSACGSLLCDFWLLKIQRSGSPFCLSQRTGIVKVPTAVTLLQVLGAELYTKVAFDKLMKRASAITDDMLQEARTLRTGANGSNELAHQVPLTWSPSARPKQKRFLKIGCHDQFHALITESALHDPPNWQLSLLLEDMVESIARMNSLAGIVHQIMLRRITKLQEGVETDPSGNTAWLSSTINATGEQIRRPSPKC